MENRGWQRREGIMLCYPFEEKRLTRWNTPAVYTQPKLDGDRCRILIYPNKEIKMLSSEGNEITSAPHILFELENLNLPPVELDGELYVHGLPHQDIHSIVSRKKELHDSFETMKFHLFDIVTDEPQIKRSITLENFYKEFLRNADSIELVPTLLTQATSEAVIRQMMEFYSEGYEGVIVRSPFGHYERRRSVDIMKFKPKQEDRYKVVGFEEEISKEGVPKNSLGALILQSDIGQVFKVGSGSFLTREARRTLWATRESLIGMTARVAYQHLTTGKVPRFPVLIDLLSIQTPDSNNVFGVEPTIE